jgi:hypothetical protein
VFQRSGIKIETSFSKLELSDVQFDCSAYGTPMPHVLWLKNGQAMSEEEFGLIRNIMKMTLKDLKISDSGNYTCQVTNQFGKLDRTFSLKVLGKQIL